MDQKNTRQAVFAGSFYPESPTDLRTAIDGYMSSASGISSARLRAMVVPHAGYRYSGTVAGYAYCSLNAYLKTVSSKPRRVFLIGPAHQVWVEGIAVSSQAWWLTPLGKTAVSPLTKTIASACDSAAINDEAHAAEHSLEVQLPFLQIVFGQNRFEIVPMLVSDMSHVVLADVLEKYYASDDLIVVSTDLSHYSPYAVARATDSATINAVLSGNVDVLSRVGDACGLTALSAVAELARRRRWTCSLAKYANSGDTTGAKETVVGYCSMLYIERRSLD